MKEFAPVVVFTYNRPEHTRKTIEALGKNMYAKDSVLYIFSDGAKKDTDLEKIEKVREYIESSECSHMFKEVKIVASPQNKGLASSIIDGVSIVMEECGRAIIVEDDVVTSVDFLKFMNKCLEYYENDQSVWSIGGYSFPMQFPDDYKYDVFVMGRGSSYAWATWKNRWNKIDWDVKNYKDFRLNWKKRKAFDYYGSDRSLMLDAWHTKNNNSWAIRFSYAMFENDMVAVLPVVSRACNIGMDGSGTHALAESHQFDTQLSEGFPEIRLGHLTVNEDIRRQYVAKFGRWSFKQITRFISITLLQIHVHDTVFYKIYRKVKYKR